MSFNLYFAGSRAAGVEEFMESVWPLRLFSFYHDKGAIAKRVEKGLKLFLDSGAFTAHTKGQVIPVDEYVAYANGIDKNLDLVAQVDTIPGYFGKPKTPSQLAEAPEKTWQNYLYMRKRMKSPDKLLYVFHQGESFKHLERALSHKPRIPYVAISPANDRSLIIKEEWLRKVYYFIAKSANPKVKTHILGMTNVRSLERFPATSADSATWLRASAYGGIRTPHGIVNLSPRMRKMSDHIDYLSEYHREMVFEYISRYGFSLEALQSEYKERMKITILFYVDWAKNYVYRPVETAQSSLF